MIFLCGNCSNILRLFNSTSDTKNMHKIKLDSANAENWLSHYGTESYFDRQKNCIKLLKLLAEFAFSISQNKYFDMSWKIVIFFSLSSTLNESTTAAPGFERKNFNYTLGSCTSTSFLCLHPRAFSCLLSIFFFWNAISAFCTGIILMEMRVEW